MQPFRPFRGLVAAPHSPFRADGTLAIGTVPLQAEHLAACGVETVFACGSTGEASSLSMDERYSLAARWAEVGPQHGLRVVVHVGHTSLVEARSLAEHASMLGVDAIAALAPYYFQPPTVRELVAFCAHVAAGAPQLPFYYYDIPGLTGVDLSTLEFIDEARGKIATLAGIKFTNSDLDVLEKCLAAEGMDILFGTDEILVEALEKGARGAVGSTYNFMAPLFVELIARFEAGDLDRARELQSCAAKFVEIIASYGYTAAAKAVMAMVGVDCGPVRLPLADLDPDARARLQAELEAAGFFAWTRPTTQTR